jgi:alkylation response protein AidB-like acyl-CoA dehydrogenase
MLNEEQEMLRDVARDWVEGSLPLARAHARLKDRGALGCDRELYSEIAQLGWTSLLIPEAYGGANFGYRGMGILLEQIGRGVGSLPLLQSGLGAVAALVLGAQEDLKSRVLPKLASGEAIVTTALDETCHHDPSAVSLTAERHSADWILNGRKRPVPFGMSADHVLVSVRTGENGVLTLFLVETDAAGLARTELDHIDGQEAAAYDLTDVHVSDSARIGEIDQGARLLDQLLDRMRIGQAAEMLGLADRAFQITLEYLRTRVQFGRRIGSFQALQHRAAELYGEIELSRSCVEAALDTLDADPEATSVSEQASLAKAIVGDTLTRVTKEMIQMHGGIGMTEEHDAGLFFKRARVLNTSFGTPLFHRERYGRLAGY